MNATDVKTYLTGLQERIVLELEQQDGGKFLHDQWEKPVDAALGGGGNIRILEGGALFERAGVAFSHVNGRQLPPSATTARPELAGRGFEAMGLSLVLHPRNPYVPTVHMNVRFFVAHEKNNTSASDGGSAIAQSAAHADEGPGVTPPAPIWWFGGGMDLTPYYGFDDDCRHFHACCKSALDPFGPELYPHYKRWCDDYFFLKHRNEPRGIGGIFFDDLAAPDFSSCFTLMRSVGDHFLPAYVPIVERRHAIAFGERERNFQAYRRGRYVEFNLVFDRGTLFGLQSGGRTESILMSMPPSVQWRYDWRPEPGSAEAALYEQYLMPRDWLAGC